MAKRSIDKRVLNVLLEAVRASLVHLRDFTTTLMERGLDAPPGMARIYNGARRLHDYLLNCAKSYRSPQEIELTDEEGNLLVSCIAHRLANVESYQGEGEKGQNSEDWLVERREILVWLAHRLMTEEVERIPHPNPIEQEYSSVLGLLGSRLDADLDRSNLIPPSREEMRQASLREVGIDGHETGEQADKPDTIQIYHGIEEVVKHTAIKPEDRRGAASVPVSAATPALFEAERLHDYKLRAFAAKDLADFATASSAGNLRLSLLHLGSLIEALVLDHYLQRREQRGLTMPPSQWNFRELTLELLGDRAFREDEAILERLLRMGDWIRPCRQLMEPSVLTPLMVQEARELLSRVLRCAGSHNQEGDVVLGTADESSEVNAAPQERSNLWRGTKHA